MARIRVGRSAERWRRVDVPPLLLEGDLAVWRGETHDATTIDRGDGEPVDLGRLVAEALEAAPDALGDRFVGRVRITVELLAVPEKPALGWSDGPD